MKGERRRQNRRKGRPGFFFRCVVSLIHLFLCPFLSYLKTPLYFVLRILREAETQKVASTAAFHFPNARRRFAITEFEIFIEVFFSTNEKMEGLKMRWVE